MNQITSASAPIEMNFGANEINDGLDEYLSWALDNRRLLALLMQEHSPSVKDAIAAKNKIIDDETCRFDYNLFSHIANYAVLDDQRQRAEERSYNAVAIAVGGKVNASCKGADVIANGNIPVEVKTGAFNVAALRQLKRYMEEMKSPYGIACGREVTVDLPREIFFLQIKYSSNDRSYVVLNHDAVSEFLSDAATMFAKRG